MHNWFVFAMCLVGNWIKVCFEFHCSARFPSLRETPVHYSFITKQNKTTKTLTHFIHTCQLSRIYPGVSRIRQQSPGLPYGSPNLPDKIELWAFLCFNLEFIPFSPKIRIFYDSKFGFWGIFARISSLTKSWKLIVMVCNSCKTSYNVLSRLGTGSNCAYGGGGGGGGVDRWCLGG